MKKLIFFWALQLILTSTWSCRQGDAGTKNSSGQKDTVTSGKASIALYRVTVDNLRLRAEPNQSSSVLAQLREGAFVQGPGKASDNTEEVELRGVMYNMPYYLVQAPDAREGWVYGGALTCVYWGPAAGVPDTGSLNDFALFLESLPEKDPESAGKAWAHVSERYPKAESAIADAVFILLDQFLRDIEREGELYKITERIPFSEKDVQAIYDGSFNAGKFPAAARLAANGFRLVASEGMVFPVVDWRKFQAFFAGKATEPVRQFIDQRTSEQNEPIYDDGGIVVPMEKVADQAVFWEKFNRDNPNFPLAEETRESERWLRLVLLGGTDNTPAFDYETGRPTPDFVRMWNYLQEKYRGTEALRQVEQLKAVLQEDGGTKGEKVQAFFDQLNGL